jgi:hypothetical protein
LINAADCGAQPAANPEAALDKPDGLEVTLLAADRTVRLALSA